MSGLGKVCCRFPKEHRLYEAMGARCPCFPKLRPLLMLGQRQEDKEVRLNMFMWWKNKWWKKLFIRKPETVYVVIQRSEYEDGTKTAQIVKVMSDWKQADDERQKLNGATDNFHTSMTCLHIKRVYFDILDFKLE